MLKHALKRPTPSGGRAAVEEAVNWASPAATFPIVVGLLAVPEYHDAIGKKQPGSFAARRGRGGGVVSRVPSIVFLLFCVKEALLNRGCPYF